VGAQPGFGSIIDGDESRLCSLTTGANNGITVTAFKHAVERMGGTVDLLKLDCEGAEWEIFQDPEPFQSVHTIRMEYHLTGGRTLHDLQQIAMALGFAIEYLSPNSNFGIIWLCRR
jgi:hypothetical protein